MPRLLTTMNKITMRLNPFLNVVGANRLSGTEPGNVALTVNWLAHQCLTQHGALSAWERTDATEEVLDTACGLVEIISEQFAIALLPESAPGTLTHLSNEFLTLEPWAKSILTRAKDQELGACELNRLAQSLTRFALARALEITKEEYADATFEDSLLQRPDVENWATTP